MAAVFQTIFSHAFSWIKMYKFRRGFHWSLFSMVQWFWTRVLNECFYDRFLGNTLLKIYMNRFFIDKYENQVLFRSNRWIHLFSKSLAKVLMGRSIMHTKPFESDFFKSIPIGIKYVTSVIISTHVHTWAGLWISIEIWIFNWQTTSSHKWYITSVFTTTLRSNFTPYN